MQAAKLSPKEVKQNLPFYRWHQRVIFEKSALNPNNKNNNSNALSSITYGQAAGGLLAGFGALSFLHGLFFKKDEKSFFGKYVWPLIGTAIGVSTVTASKPPKDIFNISLIRNGFFDVFAKLKELVNGRTFFHSVAKLFDEDKKAELKEKTDNLISSSLPLIKDLTPQELESDLEFQGLYYDINELSPFEANVDKLKELFHNYGGQRIFRFFSSNTDIAQNALREVFSGTHNKNGLRIVNSESDVSEIRDGLVTLRDCLNEIISPTGLQLDLGYGGLGDEELRVYLSSSEVFSQASSKSIYRPFISIPLELDLMFEAIKFAHDRIETIVQQQESIVALEQRFSPANQNQKDQLQSLVIRQKKNIDLLVGGTLGLLNSGQNLMLRGVKVGYFTLDENGQNHSPVIVNKTLSQQVFDGYIPSDLIKVMHEIADGPSNIQLVGEIITSFGRKSSKPKDKVRQSHPEVTGTDTVQRESDHGKALDDHFIQLDSGRKITIPEPKKLCEHLQINEINVHDEDALNKLKFYFVRLALKKYLDENNNVDVNEKGAAYEKSLEFIKDTYSRLWESYYLPDEECEKLLNRHSLIFSSVGIDLNQIGKEGLKSHDSSRLENLNSFLPGEFRFSVAKKIADALFIERAKMILIESLGLRDKEEASERLTLLAKENTRDRVEEAKHIVRNGLPKTENFKKAPTS